MAKEEFNEQNKEECSGYCASCEKFAEEQKEAEENFDWEKDQRKKEGGKKEHEDLEKLDELVKKLDKENKKRKRVV